MLHPSKVKTKTKVKCLDLSQLSLKNISPPTSFITLNSPPAMEPDHRILYTKTSANSPMSSHNKLNLYERSKSGKVLPILQNKCSSLMPSMQNIKESNTVKTEAREEMFSPIQSLHREGAFYITNSARKAKKLKHEDSFYALGQLSMYKVDITKDQQQQAEVLQTSPDRLIKPVQAESPRNENKLLFRAKGYFDIETLAKTGLKLTKKSEFSQADKVSKDAGSPRNLNVIRKINLKDRSNPFKTETQSRENSVKENESTMISTKRRTELSPESGYLLTDRQRMGKLDGNKKKNMRINLDLQAVKCFEDIKASIKGSLTHRPHVGLNPLYSGRRKLSSAAKDDVSMIKEICKEAIVPSRKL